MLNILACTKKRENMKNVKTLAPRGLNIKALHSLLLMRFWTRLFHGFKTLPTILGFIFTFTFLQHIRSQLSMSYTWCPHKHF